MNSLITAAPRAMPSIRRSCLPWARPRGELLALRWSDVDLDKAWLRVERSLDARRHLEHQDPEDRVKPPQASPAVLRDHRKRQLELRLALGPAMLSRRPGLLP